MSQLQTQQPWRRNEFGSWGQWSGAKVWGGGTDPRCKALEKNCSCPAPQLFLPLKVHIVVLVSAFVMVQFGQFAVLLVTVPPPCPAICKSGRGHMLPRAQPFVKVGGGTCFPVPYAMESAHALTAINWWHYTNGSTRNI